MKRFHLESERWSAPWLLEGPEAHHCLKVLRTRVGEEVELFDGRGRVGRFALRQAEKQRAFFEPLDLMEYPEPFHRSVLALGFNKGLRRSWLLEKAVELEATELWLWQAERSQGKMPEDVKESWETPLLAGAKQCGNPWLPLLRTFPGGLDGMLEAGRELDASLVLAEDSSTKLLDARDLAQTSLLFILGPEGGFAPDETALLRERGLGFRSLGRRVLRWDTAALTVLGLRFWARQQEGS